jgi:Acyl-CoA thioesterase C-terminal domain/Acyl-CoA thioesterase N-terminal domain
VAEAFYEPAGDDGYLASELTRGPWDPGAQHAGPLAALLGREIERVEGADEFQVGRVVFEILRPVPIGAVRIETRVLRPGKKVQLVEASLGGEGGELMRATAWLLRRHPLELPEEAIPEEDPPQGPELGWTPEFFPTGQDVGYHTAMEYRFVRGGFGDPGPAIAWTRMRVPLVEGEEPTPLERVLVAADSGNGVSATLDWSRYLFVNVDLSVHLHRPVAGEGVCLDAITIPERTGIGIADTALYDERGPVGRADQTLLIDERR